MSARGQTARAIFIAALLALPGIAAALEYQVDTANSSILIYTEKSGALSFFAHKHLIAITALQGQVSLTDEQSAAQLQMRPVDFVVDDPELRALETEKAYRKPFKASAINGTRQNMLGEDLLNAEQFPSIELSIVLKSRNGEQAVFAVSTELVGEPVEFDVPGRLIANDDELHATADFVLTHKQLGLRPFSLLGVANVGQDIRFKLDIKARPVVPQNTATP
ncbi:MAG: YceI family protein [Gammaproteobacteria bacterium]|nr:YceI family protein [Gammaproteobacteria bacterium]